MSIRVMARHIPQVWKALTGGKGFDQVLKKVNILSTENGLCRAEMIVSEEHTNVKGTLHGGMTSTIVDIVSGVALTSYKNTPVGVSVDLHITFLKGVKIGEKILIEAKTNKAGRTLAFLEVNITNKETGVLIAKGSHTKFIG